VGGLRHDWRVRHRKDENRKSPSSGRARVGRHHGGHFTSKCRLKQFLK
jgi:hypothetical protein